MKSISMLKDIKMRNQFWWTVASLGLLALSTGCGEKSGTISGRVTFEDQPISVGTIAFINQDGKVASATIERGNYTVSGVEVGGSVTVTVMSHVPSPMMHPASGPVEGVPDQPRLQYVPIPDRYGDHKSSGLSCQVVAGPQTRDFALDP